MSDVINNVRRALGKKNTPESAPIPPEIDERIVRLVQSDVGLPELLVAQARKSAMGAELVYVDDLVEKLVAFFRANQCAKIAMPVSPLLDGLEIGVRLRDAGFDVKRWDELSADAIYEYDCGLTDCYAAVAETGSLVMRATPQHGRCLSLVPPIHVAIVEPRLIVGDLLDLMEKLSSEKDHPGTAIITGPSKTSDIEGNLVTGVHGPKMVQVYVLK
ncbi:MAG TPA: LUD domain-containing protein [Tepidisphaeraceae bacterium]|jgi:L-lactate utilization protein LutC